FEKYTTCSHSLSSAAKEYLITVRASPPSRAVGTGAGSNVCSWMVSSKMGFTLATESRTAEKAFVLLSEYDEDVLEIWDQPSPIRVSRTSKNGRLNVGSYTPDFLNLTISGPIITEVKPVDILQKLLQKEPDNWRLESEGVYRYEPAYRAFSEI